MHKPDAAWPSVDVETRPWIRSDEVVASRAQLRVSRGAYDATIPPLIAGLGLVLSAEMQGLAEDAAAELARFDSEVGAIAAPFAAVLLRTESASSSQIENLSSGAKQIALAELGRSRSSNAQLIVGNVNAMKAAIRLADSLDEGAVIEMHRALLEQSDPSMVGRWRSDQVWIGGSAVSPHGADYVAPHHDRLPALMADVMSFARRADLPALPQAAIAHAQFETIHPFPDGNGRTGRALLQGMLRAAGLTRHVTIPVSAGLLQHTSGYFAALSAYRRGDVEPIVRTVAEAAFAAITNGRLLVADIESVRETWAAAVRARSDSSVHRLAELLLRQPVVSANAVARDLGISAVAAQSSIDRLEAGGVLQQFTAGRRNRMWQASDVIDALDRFAARARRQRG